MIRRALLVLSLVTLAGCASLDSVQSDISTFGEWPAARAPGSFAFDRLPSQQTRPDAAARLEAAARPALLQAGFTEVAPGQTPDVVVQVAARTTRTDVDLWADPIWWRGSVIYARHPWVLGPGWGVGLRADFPRYDREVALLIRDVASGKPLYEARATQETSTRGDDALSAALFRAALIDFPRTGINPRTVVVPLS